MTVPHSAAGAAHRGAANLAAQEGHLGRLLIEGVGLAAAFDALGAHAKDHRNGETA
ncbi:MAG: hypothetical protein AAFR47_19915 [Pseudomonadota bacterium]